jgi:hypothetical protein
MKTLLRTALVSAALVATPYIAFADETVAETSKVAVSGTYEGTITDSGTYTQTLELVGAISADAGTVTIGVDEDGDVNDLYIETTLMNMFDVRLGKVDSVTGMKVSTDVAGVTVSAYQPSGANQSIEIGAETTIGPIDFTGEDLLDDDRLLSAGMDIAGIDVGGSYQKTTTGTNTIMDAGITMSGFEVDVAHGSIGDASVTKTGDSKHALLGTMTTATNGTNVKGAKVALGDLSAKVVNLNSTNTYTVALSRGIMTYSYEQVDGGDGTASVGVKLTF